MDQELIQTKKCIHCDTECDVNVKFCAVCGSAFESGSNLEFGKGRPLKYFKFLFNFGVFYILISGINQVRDLYTNFVELYNSDIGLFFSYVTNYYLIFYITLNLVTVILLLKAKTSDNKLGFTKIYIYRLVLNAVNTLLYVLFVYIDFGSFGPDLMKFVAIFVGEAVGSILTYIYFTKRIDFKWFDFKDMF